LGVFTSTFTSLVCLTALRIHENPLTK